MARLNESSWFEGKLLLVPFKEETVARSRRIAHNNFLPGVCFA